MGLGVLAPRLPHVSSASARKARREATATTVAAIDAQFGAGVGAGAGSGAAAEEDAEQESKGGGMEEEEEEAEDGADLMQQLDMEHYDSEDDEEEDEEEEEVEGVPATIAGVKGLTYFDADDPYITIPPVRWGWGWGLATVRQHAELRLAPCRRRWRTKRSTKTSTLSPPMPSSWPSRWRRISRRWRCTFTSRTRETFTVRPIAARCSATCARRHPVALPRTLLQCTTT